MQALLQLAGLAAYSLGASSWYAGPEKIPVAILHEHGTRHGGDLCVLRLNDLRVLMTGARRPIKEITR